MVVRLSARPHDSALWVARFRRSLDNPPDIPWGTAEELTGIERARIRSSIQEFQLGERSEGRHLKRAAREYAIRSGDPSYAHAVDLFIREEQHHAALLGRYMDLAAISRADHTWMDSAFRGLRRLAGLETSICVLLTAEVIAKIYYRALHAATASPALRAICRRILEDEAAHVEFQSERIAILRRDRPRWLVRAAVGMQRLLFCGTVTAVWFRHKAVLRADGHGFRTYWRDCHREFRKCLSG
jgi:hypothetical protein